MDYMTYMMEKRATEQELTLRDKFALGALAGLLSDAVTIVEFRRTASANARLSATDAARSAYAYADAMIRQREIPALAGKSHLAGSLPPAGSAA